MFTCFSIVCMSISYPHIYKINCFINDYERKQPRSSKLFKLEDFFYRQRANMSQFLGAFANLRKRLLASSRLTVRASVRMRRNWMDFHEILYLGIFIKSIDKIHVSLNHVKNNGHFNGDLCTFTTISL